MVCVWTRSEARLRANRNGLSSLKIFPKNFRIEQTIAWFAYGLEVKLACERTGQVIKSITPLYLSFDVLIIFIKHSSIYINYSIFLVVYLLSYYSAFELKAGYVIYF